MFKKSFLIVFVICLAINAKAQVYWQNDLKSAQTVAKQTDKLILIDFWASWCEPCTMMDKQLWHHPEMQKVSKSFVGLKVNIEFNNPMALDYNVKVIPKIVLATISGETIWESEGYMNAESYLSILRLLPENVKELNQAILKFEENKKDPRANLLVGIGFQQIGKDITNNILKSSFLKSSEKYFSKALKYTEDKNLTEEIELNSTLNDLYYGKPQKAIKKNRKNEFPNYR